MADIAVVSGAIVRPVLAAAGAPHDQYEFYANEAILPGQMVRFNLANGRVEPGNATNATENVVRYMALTRARYAGQPITCVREGYIEGFDFGSLNFDSPVYLSNNDGLIADAIGTTTVIIGRVFPAPYSGTPQGNDRILRLNVPI